VAMQEDGPKKRLCFTAQAFFISEKIKISDSNQKVVTELVSLALE